MSSAPLREDEVTLGRVLSSFGIKGEVRIFLFNRESDLLAQEMEVEIVSPSGERVLRSLRIRPGAGKRIIGRLEGIEEKDQADALSDWEIRVPKTRLPDLEEGEYYHHELIGTPVETKSGRSLGRITEIYSSGGIDSWVILEGSTECYVAATRENIVEVQRGLKVVVADHVGEVG